MTFFFFSSRRRHTRLTCDWSSDVCSSDLLVGYLQPDLVGSVDEIDAVAGSEAFRRAVAPAYLRRNQEDVLSELPELVQVDEWEEFGLEDAEAYREAVASRNFMAMRRAAYASGDPAGSAK